jgi:hypothetical protein
MSDKPSMHRQVPSMVTELQHAFAAGRERRQRKLAPLLARGARSNMVLVMMANRGYQDLFNNWVRSCDINGLDVRSWAVFFAVDEEAATNAENQGFSTYIDALSYGDQPRDAVKKFGDRDFRRLMFQKTAVVQDVLELGFDVLFQDVDMIWRKDPLEYLLTAASPDFDTHFMFDGRNRWHGPPFANTGFFLLRNRPITRKFWAKVLASYAEMAICGSQQKVVNSIIREDQVRVDILPEEQFANGHLFSIDKPSRLPTNPYVIHCSWTGNREHKIQKYRREGLWYL